MSGQRWFRTAEGGLVPDGDPAGEFLAYGVADELSAEDAALVEASAKPAEPEPVKKAAVKPADKSALKPEDK